MKFKCWIEEDQDESDAETFNESTAEFAAEEFARDFCKKGNSPDDIDGLIIDTKDEAGTIIKCRITVESIPVFIADSVNEVPDEDNR
jgi:hypothetical protein